MTKPTLEEYQEARECINTLNNCITLATKHILDLLDECSREKLNISTYKELIENHQKTVIAYEILDEKESPNGNSNSENKNK